VEAGELEDLRDERVGDLERGLPLAADAELHGAAGGRALRNRERRAAGPARNVSRIPPPGDAGQGASGPIVDSWRLSTSAASRRTTARPATVTGEGGCLACGPRLGSWGDRDHAGGRRHPVGGRPGRLPAHLGVYPDRGLPGARCGHLDHQVRGVQLVAPPPGVGFNGRASVAGGPWLAIRDAPFPPRCVRDVPSERIGLRTSPTVGDPSASARS
jgi:hypothetical protein